MSFLLFLYHYFGRLQWAFHCQGVFFGVRLYTYCLGTGSTCRISELLVVVVGPVLAVELVGLRFALVPAVGPCDPSFLPASLELCELL